MAWVLAIYGITHLAVYFEIRRRRAWESRAEVEQQDTREIAESAKREAAAHTAVLERFPAARDTRND
jgi:hypothetical protein